MCGIVYCNDNSYFDLAKKAVSLLKNRGPDGTGSWSDENVFLGHTRLAMLDLSDCGKQPMETEKSVLVFNGELYNYEHLKNYFFPKNEEFVSKTDTEVLQKMLDKFGFEAITHFDLEGAFVYYNKETRKAYFFRDHSGVKPLYYAFLENGKIVVSSRIEAVREIIGLIESNWFEYKHLVSSDVDWYAMNEILAFGYPTETIFSRIRQVPPGMVMDENGYCFGIRKFAESSNKIRQVLENAVKSRFSVSDVPIAISLSGGVDSGYIAMLCSKHFKDVVSITIGFDEDDEDVKAAERLSSELDIKNSRVILDNRDFEKYLKKGIEFLEQPFCLGSVAQTFAIGEQVKKLGKYKGLIVGEGMDEIAGGYKRYAEMLSVSLRATEPEVFDAYLQRITKNGFGERKKLLGANAMQVSRKIFLTGEFETLNSILRHDFENEVRNYHLRRLDSIVSEFGIEVRVPYCSYDFFQCSQKIPFRNKVSLSRNKIFFRTIAKNSGLPKWCAERKKVPFKKVEQNDTALHLRNIVKEWLDGKGIQLH